MVFDWKKIGIWGGAITALGVVGYWLYQYQQTAAVNSAAQAAQDSQDQNQALAALLQGSLSEGGSSEPASVSGPSVDTGNDALQTLINSILNPSTGTVSETPTTPVTTAPPATATPGIGTATLPTQATTSPIITPVANPIPVTAPVNQGLQPVTFTTQPAMLTTMVQ